MRNKKTILIIGIILVVTVITLVILAIILKPNNNQGENNNPIQYIPQGERKLDNYTKSLTDNYYIKYSGKFKDNSGEYIDAIVEYTKDSKNYGLRSEELDMHIICQDERLYTISSKYKLIVEIGKESFKINEYNFVSNIGQEYINAYQENINSITYDVEEYRYNGKMLKYYFSGEDIKLINYDNKEIRVIRVEQKTNKELLAKPNGYKYAIV